MMGTPSGCRASWLQQAAWRCALCSRRSLIRSCWWAMWRMSLDMGIYAHCRKTTCSRAVHLELLHRAMNGKLAAASGLETCIYVSMQYAQYPMQSFISLIVLAQEFDADVLVGDVAYACALGQSEILRRGEGRGRLPRVMVSALPILDPLVPGRMENMPNNLAYVPQMGTSLSNRMVSQPRVTAAHASILAFRA